MIDIYSLNAGQLDELGNNMEDGLTQWAGQLKITQMTPAEIAAELADFLNADNAYNAGRSQEQEASDAVQAAQGALFAWLGVVKGVLTSSFGQRWSSQWVQVGFITPSIAIPGKTSEQYSLATRMIAFLTNNANFQVPEVKATAAQGTLLQRRSRPKAGAQGAGGGDGGPRDYVGYRLRCAHWDDVVAGEDPPGNAGCE